MSKKQRKDYTDVQQVTEQANAEQQAFAEQDQLHSLLVDIVKTVREKATRIEYSGHTVYCKGDIVSIIAYDNVDDSNAILVIYKDSTRKYISSKTTAETTVDELKTIKAAVDSI